MTNLVWRVRVALPVRLAPGGWEVVTVKYQEQPQLAARTTVVRSPDGQTITNGYHTVNAHRSATGVGILADGRPLVGGDGLGVWLYDDPYGSWGGLLEQPVSFWLTRVRENLSMMFRDMLVYFLHRFVDFFPRTLNIWIFFLYLS